MKEFYKHLTLKQLRDFINAQPNNKPVALMQGNFRMGRVGCVLAHLALSRRWQKLSISASFDTVYGKTRRGHKISLSLPIGVYVQNLFPKNKMPNEYAKTTYGELKKAMWNDRCFNILES